MPGVWSAADDALRCYRQPLDGTRIQGLWQWFYRESEPDYVDRNIMLGYAALRIDEYYETLREAREALPGMRRAREEDS
jgi:hypothetical protein